MSNLSDLVPFHSGQVTCPGTLLVLGQVKNKCTILYFIFGNYYELTFCVEKSVEFDQLIN